MSAYFPPVCQSWQRLPGRNDPVPSLPGEEREGGNEFPAGIGAGQEQAAVYEVSISEWERALLEHEKESFRNLGRGLQVMEPLSNGEKRSD